MSASSTTHKATLTRRQLIHATGAGALSLGLASPALSQQKFTMRLAHSEAVGAPLTQALQRWCDTLNSRSGGRIDAQHFPGSQLGSYTQLIEQSRIGTIQATVGGPDTEESVAPEIAATGGAPGFIFRDETHVDRILQGPLGDEVSAVARRKTGVEFVAYAEVGFRHILSKRPVTNLESLKGLKIRVPEIKVWVDFWRRLGASPTPLPYAEQYTALSTGVIEAVEADFFSILGFKWFEQAKHLTLSYHWFLPKAIRVNARWLDGLPADLQALVRQSARDIFAEQRRDNRLKTDAALADLVKAGVTVHRLPNDEASRWFATARPLFDEFSSKSADTKAMVGRILAAR
jgi:tripartite ATP-independent transporter DctP family solute receptor